jgi:hypothetical protein
MVATTSGATSMKATSITRRRSQDAEKQALALDSSQKVLTFLNNAQPQWEASIDRAKCTGQEEASIGHW